MQPITDPPIPFLHQFQGGFTPGQMVRIQGFASPVADRFDINFQTSATTPPRDDIGLHLSVRLTEGYVARNSIQGGVWGEEQNNGELPIQPGEKYEIIVLSDRSEYKIAINGKHFGEFPHRIAPSDITHLSIDGGTSLSLISFETFNPQPQTRQAAPPQQFNPAFEQSQNQYGPPRPDQYAPSAGQFGGPPPGYAPQPGYGQPGQFGQPGGYGPPPPPPGSEEKSGGFDNFLESAGPLFAGVIKSGVADKLLTSITSGGNPQQAQSPNQPQQQRQTQPIPQQENQIPHQQQQPDLLGGLGSLISNFTGGQNPQQPIPQHPQQPPPSQPQQLPQKQPAGGADILEGIGSLLSTLRTSQTTNTSTQQQQLHSNLGPAQNQPQSGPQGAQQPTPDYIGAIGQMISNYTSSQNQQSTSNKPPPQPTPPITQPAQQQPSQTPDYLGAIGSLISNYAASQNQQTGGATPQQIHPQPQPAQQPQPKVDVIGGITSLLSNLNTNQGPAATVPQQAQYPPPQPPSQPQFQPGIYPQLPNDANSQNAQTSQQQQQQQQPPQSTGTDAFGGLGSLLSSFTAPSQPQSNFAPSNVGGQGSVGNLGSMGSLLSSFAGQILQPQPQNRGGQPQ